ncbi:tRNA sulfurtransferase [Thalassocella blandensis]|nr:tRNA sulfurtransferase [Thalassocella blandensis]
MTEEKKTESAEKLVFTVRMFPEITIKSPPVRKRWTRHLTENIRLLGRQIVPRTSVVQDWDRLEVRVGDTSEEVRLQFIDLLGRIPGIANFSEVKAKTFKEIHDIYEAAQLAWQHALVGKTFCVRVKRSGSHTFTSTEVERYVGGGLNQNIATGGVKLKDPDVTVHIEIKDNMFYMVDRKYPGLGGFPVGTQDHVLSLVSGGFDSTVASFQMIKRGLRTHYCFFNLGGRAHELGVKEIAYYLWRKYGATHRVRFITVPFEGVVNEILEKISPSNMGVVLKRMMLRAAEKVAERGGIEALVTGEAVSQVSSQTIPNLAIIDKVTDMLVLRPLIATDKTDIIRMAREIGVEEFSANIPEYCGVIAVKPSAKVKPQEVLREEESFDFATLEQALAACSVQSIDDVVSDIEASGEVECVSQLPAQAIVIDVRHPSECELKPLVLNSGDAVEGAEGIECLEIPFFRLSTQFETLNRESTYYLYCDKGVMSELHAAHLKDAGFANVAVFRPEK